MGSKGKDIGMDAIKKKQQLRYKLGVVLLNIILIITGCSKTSLTRYQGEFLNLFDTVTQVVGYASTKEEFQQMMDIIYEDLEEYHQLYDIYNTYEGINNIKTINDNAGVMPVEVDRKIIDLILYSKEMYKNTNSNMNIAFGSVLSIWHEYREISIEYPDKAAIPPINLLKEASKHTNIDRVIINEKENTIYLEDKDMKLDVGAIAKGYAVEQVKNQMIGRGQVKGLISVGGNVSAIGTKEDNTMWKIGIQNPDKNSSEQYLNKVVLKDQSLVTSGNYQRYFTVEGKQYHHIINKDTLMPANHFVAVSVISKNSGEADALSTALYNVNYEQGQNILKGYQDVEVMWVYEDGKIEMTKGFEKLIRE